MLTGRIALNVNRMYDLKCPISRALSCVCVCVCVCGQRAYGKRDVFMTLL